MVNKLLKTLFFSQSICLFVFLKVTVGTCNYVNKCKCLLLV